MQLSDISLCKILVICCAIITLVADEPTGNLDKQTEEEILEIFKDLAHKEGKCVIIVTHLANVCEEVDEVFDLKRVKK